MTDWLQNPTDFQGMPKASVPLMSDDGTMNMSWYRFFVALYNKTGLHTPGIAVSGADRFKTGAFINPGGHSCAITYVDDFGVYGRQINIFDQITGKFIGQITIP